MKVLPKIKLLKIQVFPRIILWYKCNQLEQKWINEITATHKSIVCSFASKWAKYQCVIFIKNVLEVYALWRLALTKGGIGLVDSLCCWIFTEDYTKLSLFPYERFYQSTFSTPAKSLEAAWLEPLHLSVQSWFCTRPQDRHHCRWV